MRDKTTCWHGRSHLQRQLPGSLEKTATAIVDRGHSVYHPAPLIGLSKLIRNIRVRPRGEDEPHSGGRRSTYPLNLTELPSAQLLVTSSSGPGARLCTPARLTHWSNFRSPRPSSAPHSALSRSFGASKKSDAPRFRPMRSAGIRECFGATIAASGKPGQGRHADHPHIRLRVRFANSLLNPLREALHLILVLCDEPVVEQRQVECPGSLPAGGKSRRLAGCGRPGSCRCRSTRCRRRR